MNSSFTLWVSLVAFALATICGGIVVYVWMKGRRDERADFKADEYVTDTLQAARARASTRIEELTDHEAAVLAEKEFGGPE